MNESCHTLMNESCHTHEWVMSHSYEWHPPTAFSDTFLSCTTVLSHVTLMNESCHTHEWVMSHSYEWHPLRSRTWDASLWVTSRVTRSHVTLVKTSHGTLLLTSHAPLTAFSDLKCLSVSHVSRTCGWVMALSDSQRCLSLSHVSRTWGWVIFFSDSQRYLSLTQRETSQIWQSSEWRENESWHTIIDESCATHRLEMSLSDSRVTNLGLSHIFLWLTEMSLSDSERDISVSQRETWLSHRFVTRDSERDISNLTKQWVAHDMWHVCVCVCVCCWPLQHAVRMSNSCNALPPPLHTHFLYTLGSHVTHPWVMIPSCECDMSQTHIYIYIYVCICTYMYIYTHRWVLIPSYECDISHSYIYIYMYTYVHICTYIHTHDSWYPHVNATFHLQWMLVWILHEPLFFWSLFLVYSAFVKHIVVHISGSWPSRVRFLILVWNTSWAALFLVPFFGLFRFCETHCSTYQWFVAT